ncbi:MAG: A/G-specific adenine glycosylase [Nitrospirae bacterium]|nr:A/G-specific adenine glycosylase [Nitrospirota bacterium]
MKSTSRSDPPRKSLKTDLLKWYRKAGRDLPWRRTVDPYAVWVSEIMLQQTQVATVIPYYRSFLSAFPGVADLAKAPLERVLKVWEGMGYYARARNLHQAARVVLDEHDGEVPDDLERLTRLPGIGRSTAGAIVSIAYGKKAPILDGNVRRVLARLFAVREPVSLPAVQQKLWGLSEQLVPEKDASSFNQALMDLGAMVCTPKTPACSACCINTRCLAYREGIQEKIPAKTPSPKTPHYHVAVGVIWKNGKVLITQRPPKGLLGGLWEFPGGKLEDGETPESAVRREIREELNLAVSVGDPINVIRHAYTHFKITLHSFHCTYQGGRIRTGQPYCWVPPSELNRYAFPAANRKIIDCLEKDTPSS